MNRILAGVVVTSFICGTFILNAVGQTAPETITLKQTPFYLVDTLEARVESKSETSVKVDAKKWAQFKVAEVVPQGTIVQPGDRLITFENNELTSRLQEAKYELDLARMDLDAAEAEIEFMSKTYPIDEQLMKRAWEYAQEDAKYYIETQRPMAESQAKRQLENSEYQVENAQEELDQLRKMYKADHLTEESEQIVLKRAERALEQSQFYLDMTKINTARQLEVDIPRVAKERENALERGQLEFEKKSIELPRMVRKKQLEYAKLKFAFEKKERDYAELIADAEFMQLTAPVAGTVYHGHARRGAWRKGATPVNRLIDSGDMIAVGLPVITVVDTKNMQLRCDFDQRQRSNLKVGTKVMVAFDDRPEERIEGAIVEIGQFPLDDGKFDGLIQLPSFPVGIVPGLTCKVKVVTYKNDQAILVPKASVFSDDGGLSQYVYILDGENPLKRPVVALREQGDQVEVTQGLAAGDKILKKKPE